MKRFVPKSKKARIASVLTLLALVAVAAAAAAWLIQGNGIAKGKGGQAAPLSIEAVSPSPGGYLYPGVQGAPAAFAVSENQNNFPVTFQTVSVTGNGVLCDEPPDLVVNTGTYTLPAPVTVAAGDATPAIEIPGVFDASYDLDNSCQNADLNVLISVTDARPGNN